MNYGPEVLAEAVRQRRLELGLTQEDVVVRAREAGQSVSLGTIRGVEQGQRHGLRDAPKRGVAAGLDWEPEHIDRLLTGPGPERPKVFATREEAMDEARAMVMGKVPESESIVMAVFDRLTEDQRRITFRAARSWVAQHPEYTEDLGGTLDTLDDMSPEERVNAVTEFAKRALSAGAN